MSSEAKRRSGYRPKYGTKCVKDMALDKSMLDKGKLITEVRKSSDLNQAVRDRLCLWPTGDEIVTLLMLLQSEQTTKSYRQSSVQPKPPSSPPNIVFNDDIVFSRKSSVSYNDSSLSDWKTLRASQSHSRGRKTPRGLDHIVRVHSPIDQISKRSSNASISLPRVNVSGKSQSRVVPAIKSQVVIKDPFLSPLNTKQKKELYISRPTLKTIQETDSSMDGRN
ncbi:hypothetical protein Bpfe_028874 [Biomphalaria pfeifferi]|uniref:Uncharacterized protein n=1 Tax=Biomphalaria pfeifferi TaxID=112525 RepID=A0AAD8AU57_BIOPF|nr:hypothetical protein Bpfe_028874 [Biomphalaria pfeifferi]